MQIANTLPELIGNTPCFGWSGLPPGQGCWAKLESFNPCPPPRPGRPYHDFGRRGGACSSPAR